MEKLMQMEQMLREQSTQLSSRDDYDMWVQKCDECIELLEEHGRAKRARLSIGIKQSLVTRIMRLESFKNILQRRFVRVGSGHSARDAGLVWCGIDTAFNSRVLTGAVINMNHIEPRQFLKDARSIVFEQVQNAMNAHGNLKVNTVFNGEFVAGEKHAFKSINTKNCGLMLTSDLQEWYERCIVEPTLTSLEEFQERDSGWALLRILNLTINVNKYNPLHAGCHQTPDLPHEIKLKKAVINVKTADNACFAWAVVSALYPAERNTDRESSYPHYNTVLNLQGIEFPMKMNQVTMFERLNNISINVFTTQNKKHENEATTIVPIRLTKEKRVKHVNLLYISNPRDHNTGHFTWIKNLSRLVSSQVSKKKIRKYICDR